MMKTLLFIIGPSAVGKMTVGEEIANRTGFPLFHNHLAVEPVLRVFPFGSRPFMRLVDEFRVRMIEEVAESDLAGLILTFVIAFDLPEEVVLLEKYADIFRSRGGTARYLELSADLDERLRRNEGESRLLEKRSKRDVEFSRQLVVGEMRYQLNSDESFRERDDWLYIDNTDLTPDIVADRAVAHFGLA